jgi:hypothetical protein
MTEPVPVELDPGPEAELDRLERGKQWDLLDAIDAAITRLAADPGAPSSRQRSFAGSGFGITVRTRHDDWLVVWEHDQDVIAVRCKSGRSNAPERPVTCTIRPGHLSGRGMRLTAAQFGPWPDDYTQRVLADQRVVRGGVEPPTFRFSGVLSPLRP